MSTYHWVCVLSDDCLETKVSSSPNTYTEYVTRDVRNGFFKFGSVLKKKLRVWFGFGLVRF